MPTTEMIFPEYIRLDGDTQPRAKIDQAVCDDYGERMKVGEKFPAIDVFFDGENYWLADGFHRVQAYALAVPGEAIECNVYQGSLQDAQWHSYSVNKTHGIRRTNADKERAVKLALAHPKCQELSDAAIADHVGVRRETILRYRHKPEADLLQSHKSTHRTGRDGRTIKTAQIGKGKRTAAPRPRSPAEYHEARQAGHKVRPPASLIKLELPNNHAPNCAYDLLRYFTFEYLQDVFAEIVRLNQEPQEKESQS